MFNIENYFRPSGSDVGLPLEFVYFVYLSFLTFINLLYFLRTRNKLKENQYPQSSTKYFFLTMLGLVIWNFGELTLSISLFVFNNQKSLLVGTDNFFLVLGVIFATVFFSMYIQTILKTKKYKSKKNLVNKRFVNIIAVIALFCFVLVFGRFIALGFLDANFRQTSLGFTLILLLISVVVIITLLFFVINQLRSEKKGVSSKLNQLRITFFIWYYIVILISLIGILIFLVFSIIEINPYILYLAPFIIFLMPTFAIMLLYYGLFTPIWIQKRFGVLPDFSLD